MMISIKKTITSMLIAFLLPAAYAFQSPRHQSLMALRQTIRASPILDTNTALHLEMSSIFGDSFILADAISDPKGAAVAAAAATAGVPDPTSLFNTNIGEVFQNIAVGFTAIVFLLVGGTQLLAAILIPAGAEQLKIECTALIPDKYKEYVDKLEEGQEMKDRPDLMFELGLLLNKCKADRMQQICVEAKLAPELWAKYQNMLSDDQELQDRPELIAALNSELLERAAFVLKENKNICPEETWKIFEEKAGDTDLVNSPVLLEEMAMDLGYPDIIGAVTACLFNDNDAKPTVVEGDARSDATTLSGITDIRRSSNQWDEEDE